MNKSFWPHIKIYWLLAIYSTRKLYFLDESCPFADKNFFLWLQIMVICRLITFLILFSLPVRLSIGFFIPDDATSKTSFESNSWQDTWSHCLQFSSLHTTLRREIIALNTNWLQAFKELVKMSNWWYFGSSVVIFEKKVAF